MIVQRGSNVVKFHVNQGLRNPRESSGRDGMRTGHPNSRVKDWLDVFTLTLIPFCWKHGRIREPIIDIEDYHILGPFCPAV